MFSIIFPAVLGLFIMVMGMCFRNDYTFQIGKMMLQSILTALYIAIMLVLI